MFEFKAAIFEFAVAVVEVFVEHSGVNDCLCESVELGFVFVVVDV